MLHSRIKVARGRKRAAGGGDVSRRKKRGRVKYVDVIYSGGKNPLQ